MVDISLTPSVSSVSTGEFFTVIVRAEAGTQQMDALEVHLDFDPSFMIVQSLEAPSGGFQLDIIPAEFDNTAGTIDRAALAFFNFPSGTIDFLIIEFKVVATSGNTNVTFNSVFPRETIATFGGMSVLGDLTPGQAAISGALPVELMDFDGWRAKDAIELNWATATEINNDYFEIERSGDGRNFESIAMVNGAGTTTAIQSYTFEDKKPLFGPNYYRLKQVDFDGKTSTSEIIYVAFDRKSHFTVFPNPVPYDRFTIQYPNALSNELSIDLYDCNGKLLFQQTKTVYKGDNFIEVITPTLNKGHYMLFLRSEELQDAIPIIKG